ncbi:MAG: hypothetical protein ACT7A5_09660 [Ferrovibrionaceae bacterium]
MFLSKRKKGAIPTTASRILTTGAAILFGVGVGLTGTPDAQADGMCRCNGNASPWRAATKADCGKNAWPNCQPQYGYDFVTDGVAGTSSSTEATPVSAKLTVPLSAEAQFGLRDLPAVQLLDVDEANSKSTFYWPLLVRTVYSKTTNATSEEGNYYRIRAELRDIAGRPIEEAAKASIIEQLLMGSISDYIYDSTDQISLPMIINESPIASLFDVTQHQVKFGGSQEISKNRNIRPWEKITNNTSVRFTLAPVRVKTTELNAIETLGKLARTAAQMSLLTGPVAIAASGISNEDLRTTKDTVNKIVNDQNVGNNKYSDAIPLEWLQKLKEIQIIMVNKKNKTIVVSAIIPEFGESALTAKKANLSNSEPFLTLNLVENSSTPTPGVSSVSYTYETFYRERRPGESDDSRIAFLQETAPSSTNQSTVVQKICQRADSRFFTDADLNKLDSRRLIWEMLTKTSAYQYGFAPNQGPENVLCITEDMVSTFKDELNLPWSWPSDRKNTEKTKNSALVFANILKRKSDESSVANIPFRLFFSEDTGLQIKEGNKEMPAGRSFPSDQPFIALESVPKISIAGDYCYQDEDGRQLPTSSIRMKIVSDNKCYELRLYSTRRAETTLLSGETGIRFDGSEISSLARGQRPQGCTRATHKICL